MKQALIKGTRIVEVKDSVHPVHPDFFWAEVPDDTTVQDTFVDSAVVKFEPPAPEPLTVQQQILTVELLHTFTERGLREWFLTDVIAAGVIQAAILDPATPLDEQAPSWLAFPVMLRRAVLAERSIRALRAQL